LGLCARFWRGCGFVVGGGGGAIFRRNRGEVWRNGAGSWVFLEWRGCEGDFDGFFAGLGGFAFLAGFFGLSLRRPLAEEALKVGLGGVGSWAGGGGLEKIA
jgi:hypothetical protein